MQQQDPLGTGSAAGAGGAASDETAVMPQTESVMAVASAVSQAAEHIERARIAIRLLGRSLGS